MYDVLIETFRAVVTCAICINLFIIGKKANLHNQQGWRYILVGFGLLFFGTLVDITDNFPGLNRFVIIGDTVYESILEKIAGYSLGSLLLAVGFWKWMPTILSLRETKEELQASEIYFRKLIDHSFDIITVLGSDGVILFESPSFERIFGYKPEEVVGKKVFDFVHPEDVETALKTFQASFQQPGVFQHQELRFLHKDGTWRIIEATSKHAGDTLSGRVIVNSRDITERRRAEEELRISRELLVKAEKIGHIGSWQWDVLTNEVRWSEELYRVYGYEPHEISPDYEVVLKALHPASKEAFLDNIAASLRGERLFEMDYVFFQSNGSERVLYTIGEVIRDKTGKPVQMTGIVQDITDRKRAEKELRNLALQWQQTFDAISSSVFLLDSEQKITRCNKATKLILGKTQDEIIGRRCWELVHGTTEPIAACPLKRLKKTLQRESLVLPTGNRWLQVTVDPFLDEAGNMTGAVHSINDITEQKNNEEELFKARNLESLGILAGGIAHDFNNLLQGILGNIAMAKLHTPETSKAFTFLQGAEKLYAVSSDLTNQFLAFATGGISVRETFQLGEVIRDAVSFSLSGSNVRAIFDIAADLESIHADKGQIRRVLNNLVLNARDAMPAGGSLLVKAANERINEKENHHPFKPGKYLKISIQDQGSGISMEKLPRIFDPYFSTKQRGSRKGMGLGLSICDTIIKKHGGVITCDSELGKGTTFQIFLPAGPAVLPAQTTEAEPQIAAAATRTDRAGPRILIMDDDPGVYQVAADFLGLSGYRVDSVVNGDEAIGAYRAANAAGDPYAVIVLDLTIRGGMGGKEAITILREIDPGVKAIVSSGYANDPVMTEYASFGFRERLAKPYPLMVLKSTLDRVISGCQ